MVLLLQLVNHCYSIVLDADEALALLVEEHVVFAKTVLARASAGLQVAEVSGGREGRSIS